MKYICRIGNNAQNDLVIHDRAAADFHAQLSMDADDRVWVKDLDTKYGTRVNGHRVSKHELTYADELRIGFLVIDWISIRNTWLAAQTVHVESKHWSEPLKKESHFDTISTQISHKLAEEANQNREEYNARELDKKTPEKNTSLPTSTHFNQDTNPIESEDLDKSDSLETPAQTDVPEHGGQEIIGILHALKNDAGASKDSGSIELSQEPEITRETPSIEVSQRVNADDQNPSASAEEDSGVAPRALSEPKISLETPSIEVSQSVNADDQKPSVSTEADSSAEPRVFGEPKITSESPGIDVSQRLNADDQKPNASTEADSSAELRVFGEPKITSESPGIEVSQRLNADDQKPSAPTEAESGVETNASGEPKISPKVPGIEVSQSVNADDQKPSVSTEADSSAEPRAFGEPKNSLVTPSTEVSQRVNADDQKPSAPTEAESGVETNASGEPKISPKAPSIEVSQRLNADDQKPSVSAEEESGAEPRVFGEPKITSESPGIEVSQSVNADDKHSHTPADQASRMKHEEPEEEQSIMFDYTSRPSGKTQEKTGAEVRVVAHTSVENYNPSPAKPHFGNNHKLMLLLFLLICAMLGAGWLMAYLSSH